MLLCSGAVPYGVHQNLRRDQTSSWAICQCCQQFDASAVAPAICRRNNDGLRCPACGRRYPVQADVPVMVCDAIADRGALLDANHRASCVWRALDLPTDIVNQLRLRRASGARTRVGVAGAAGRTGLPEDGRLLCTPWCGVPHRTLARLPPHSMGSPKCEWLGEYIPRTLRRWRGVFWPMFASATPCAVPPCAPLARGGLPLHLNGLPNPETPTDGEECPHATAGRPVAPGQDSDGLRPASFAGVLLMITA